MAGGASCRGRGAGGRGLACIRSSDSDGEDPGLHLSAPRVMPRMMWASLVFVTMRETPWTAMKMELK